ncbi:hypothetical protein Micbo1qcDRAFT_179054 [Microdochium bolleyi]|uniref:Apple domain-containing protein n=1 Tax=Microdochium bolleyi TaxID=196109 RepID=A0A136IRX9_9PEZI|nr:hypothetical protein Micbo1qcDRAFT_179054 [Microdochium bolleyi]
MILSVPLLAAVLSLVEVAACAPPPPPGNGYCSTGIYKHLQPLSDYPPAQAFCSSKFPIPANTITETKTTTVAKPKRTTAPEYEFRRSDPRNPLLDELQGLNKDKIRSACACIQTTPTITRTTTVTKTSTNPAGPTSACPSPATATLTVTSVSIGPTVTTTTTTTTRESTITTTTTTATTTATETSITTTTATSVTTVIQDPSPSPSGDSCLGQASTFRPNQPCGCAYAASCFTTPRTYASRWPGRDIPAGQESYTTCAASCDRNFYCELFTYSGQTRECFQYSGVTEWDVNYTPQGAVFLSEAERISAGLTVWGGCRGVCEEVYNTAEGSAEAGFAIAAAVGGSSQKRYKHQ